MDDKEKAALQELLDCQGVIDHCSYTEEELAPLKSLEAKGLVALSWRLTQRGEKAAKAEKS